MLEWAADTAGLCHRLRADSRGPLRRAIQRALRLLGCDAGLRLRCARVHHGDGVRNGVPSFVELSGDSVSVGEGLGVVVHSACT